MPLAIPPELKPITAYIRRAEELDADKGDPSNRVIAFYCRSYAMEKAMEKASSGSEAVNSFLMALMQDLETVKPSISATGDEAKAVCEGYAVGIFHRADDEDRGSSDNYREIARTFYNSSTFFDILEQFGPLDEELNSKRTYSKWKATEIMKALREGRTPTSGGYGGDEAPPRSSSSSSGGGVGLQDLSLGLSLPAPPTGDTSVAGFQMPQQPQYGQQQQPPQQQYQQPPQQQYQQPPQQQYQQPPPQQQYLQPPPPPQQQQFQPPVSPPAQQQPQTSLQPASHQPSPHYVAPPKTTNLQGNVADAMELCAFAMAALKHNDTKMGREKLRDALNLLS